MISDWSQHEPELVASLSQGDQAAFRKLFDHYSDAIYKYARSLLKSTDAAEEIVQDVFLKIWTVRATLDPGKSFKSFVFTIARNMAFNALAKAASDENLRQSVFYSSQAEAPAADVTIRESECKALKKHAIESLPEKRRQIFKMARKKGMTYEEISRELGISVHTVRNQMSKALETMRLLLD